MQKSGDAAPKSRRRSASQNGCAAPLRDGTKIDLLALPGKLIFEPEQGQQKDK
jgi:hypothetical protein